MEFWGVGSHGTVAPGYGLDLGSGFVVCQGIFIMLLECPHETVKVVQLWGIIIVKGDPQLQSPPVPWLHTTPLPLRWLFLDHIGPDLSQEET